MLEFAGAEVTAPLIHEKPDMFHKNVITVQFAKVCNQCTISLVSGKKTVTCNRCSLTIKCQNRQFSPLLCVSMNAKTCFCPKTYILSF